jgi:hypothetical protein
MIIKKYKYINKYTVVLIIKLCNIKYFLYNVYMLNKSQI